MATSYYFWGHQRVGLLRETEKMVYWCMPLFLLYFISSFYHFLSFTPFFFFFLLLVSYSLVVGCSSFGLFFSLVRLSRCLLLFYYGFFPLGASAPLSPLLSVFFLSISIPFFCCGYLPFIANWFNGISPFYPYGFTKCCLLWASFQDYPLTHWLPLPLLSTCLLQCFSFHDKIPFCLFLLYTFTSRWLNKDWATSLPNFMACIRWSQRSITSFW